VRRRFAVLLGAGLALGAAAPASAAEVNVVGLDSLVFDKPTVNIAVGDKVTWTFEPNQPHNVVATSPNWNIATSATKPAPPTSWDFAAEGVYTYVCEIHSTTMTGQVVVGSPPPPPPPPLSEQPFRNDSAITTGAYEVGGVDTTRPSLRGVAVKKGGAKRVRIGFRVSEQSVVTVKLTRRGKTVKTKRANASRRGTVTFAGLKAGRYRIRLSARDVAGNASSVRTARVTLR
jgi:plastocyanin